MIENGAKYSSRQWMLISFLLILIFASVLLITQYSGLGTHIALLASGRQINYLETVEFPDIDELDGMFPETDNSELPSEVEGLIDEQVQALETVTPTTKVISPTPTQKIVTQTPKPAPTSIKASPTYTLTPIPTTIAVRDYSIPWPVAPGCPTTTLSCVPCILGGDSRCRVEPGETHGFLGWSCQNDNPGNIRPSEFRDGLIVAMGGTASCGIRYDSRGGSYMVFRDYNTGFNGLKAYLKAINAGMHSSYTGCGDCTLRFFAEKYSANYTTYANNLGSYLGVNPDTTTLRFLVENRLDDLARGIQHVEGFITQ